MGKPLLWPDACTTAFDKDGDGSADEKWKYFYDAAGRIKRKERDTRGTCTYAQPAENEPCEFKCQGPNGFADAVVEYDYDAAGRLVEDRRDEKRTCTTLKCNQCYSEGCQGCPTYCDEQKLEDCDGAKGAWEHVTKWTHDAAGNVLSKSVDADGNGFIDSKVSFTYDTEGNVIKESFDNDANGFPDDVWTYERDAAGRVLKKTRDFRGACTYAQPAVNESCELKCQGPDGFADQTWTYAYDAQGNLLFESEDHRRACTTLTCNECYKEDCPDCPTSCYEQTTQDCDGSDGKPEKSSTRTFDCWQ